MKSDIEKAIKANGEPVEYTAQGSSQTQHLTALVQLPIDGSLVNDYDLTAFIVYFAASDFTTPPAKFDRVRIRGVSRAIEEIHAEKLSGETLAYIARVRG